MQLKTLTLIFLVLPAFVFGQSIVLSTDTLDFGTQDENSSLTKSLNLSGNGEVRLDVFNEINYGAFNLSQQSFSVSGSTDVDMTYAPKQNMALDLPMVVVDKLGDDHLVYLEGECQYTNSYYDDTFNKEGEDLESTLGTILSTGYVTLSYAVARDNMYATIDNENGDVECVYTGRTATFNTRSGANANSFNCEHTFPQGMFSSQTPMQSDIHHLFPTDVNANSQRGNLPFGEVTGSVSWTQGGSKKGSTHFEPRDEHKGDVARAMMYFYLRHGDFQGFFAPQESVFRQWHEQDSVSQKELDRNDDIEVVQGNRSPLVDYPQFLDRMPDLASNTGFGRDPVYISKDTVHVYWGTNGYNVKVAFGNLGDIPLSYTNFSAGSNLGLVTSSIDGSFSKKGVRLINLEFSQIGPESGWVHFDSNYPAHSQDSIFVILEQSSSILEKKGEPRVIAFPNPSMERIQIENASPDQSFRITNAHGKVVKNGIYNDGIQVESLAPGNYIIQCEGRVLKFVR